jgi:uncharacterized Zn finger protein (UPF0148 family)
MDQEIQKKRSLDAIAIEKLELQVEAGEATQEEVIQRQRTSIAEERNSLIENARRKDEFSSPPGTLVIRTGLAGGEPLSTPPKHQIVFNPKCGEYEVALTAASRTNEAEAQQQHQPAATFKVGQVVGAAENQVEGAQERLYAHIEVQKVNGEVLRLLVKDLKEAKVLQLKQALERLDGSSAAMQTLFLLLAEPEEDGEDEGIADTEGTEGTKGTEGAIQELSDDSTAHECGITDGCTISLVLKAACPKCSLPTVIRDGRVFCSKAWEHRDANDQYFDHGGSQESGGPDGGTGCGWSESPFSGPGSAKCGRCGSTMTLSSGGKGGWDGVWSRRDCDNPNCGYKYNASGMYR